MSVNEIPGCVESFESQTKGGYSPSFIPSAVTTRGKDTLVSGRRGVGVLPRKVWVKSCAPVYPAPTESHPNLVWLWLRVVTGGAQERSGPNELELDKCKPQLVKTKQPSTEHITPYEPWSGPRWVTNVGCLILLIFSEDCNDLQGPPFQWGVTLGGQI